MSDLEQVMQEAQSQIKSSSAVKAAVEQGQILVNLWPLSKVEHMNNDMKYAENLQVRICRVIVSALLEQRVSIADAEYVYEGADEIPGVSQDQVNALMQAYDMYDSMDDYSRNGDLSVITSALHEYESVFSSEQWDRLTSCFNELEQYIQVVLRDSYDFTHRFSSVITACLYVLRTVDAQALLEKTVILLPYINELCERLEIPRICLDAKQCESLIQSLSLNDSAEFIELFASAAQLEWAKHYEDVLWDQVEAKKRAREEDERKSREALAAKFAHIEGNKTSNIEEL
ncbi:MAG: hypothetical protein Q3961_01635 [Bifidobacteriaceae bacterium]|nr:hypothetical protein [Bifidobacteriaceae bacterium]